MDLEDIFNTIRSHITHITDLRNLSRVCKLYNKLCPNQINELENAYKKKYSSLTLVKYFEKYSIEKFTLEIVFDGYYDLLTEIYYNENNKIICAILALCGNIELLKRAHEKLCPIDDYIISCAAYGGNVDILDWVTLNCNVDINGSNICHNASINGHINILEWVKLNNYELFVDTCTDTAMRYNYLNILEWLLHNGYNIKGTAFRIAARNGYLNILQWALQNNVQFDRSICKNAGIGGHVHILQWALENNKFDNDTTFCSNAAINGHINVLQWAIENKYYIDPELYKSAVHYGQLKVIEWLYDHDYKPDNDICNRAIESDSIEILQWALNHNYTLEPSFCDLAVEHDSIDILQWALGNNYKIDNLIYKKAIETNRVEVMEWLIKNNFVIEPVTCNIKENNKEMIKILLMNNYLNVDMNMCLKLLSFDIDVIKHLSDKYFIGKKQYHYIICNGMIEERNYGDSNDCNKQKIICYENDGDINVCDFNCDCKCWWYFLAYCITKYVDVVKFTESKINECKYHKKYINLVT